MWRLTGSGWKKIIRWGVTVTRWWIDLVRAGIITKLATESGEFINSLREWASENPATNIDSTVTKLS